MLSEEERNHPRGSGWARVYDKLQVAIAKATGQEETAGEGTDKSTEKADILATWDECPAEEAFAIFSLEGYDNATIADALGQKVASEYAHWISANLTEKTGEGREA